MAKQMTEKEKSRILYLYSQGFMQKEIAADLGRTSSCISKFLAKQETLPERIERVPETLLERDQFNTPKCCQGCTHRRHMAGVQKLLTYCSYANDMEAAGYLGVVRGCPVDRCTHYEKGRPERRYPTEITRGLLP